MINVASIISDDSEMSGSTSVAPLHTLTPSRRERFENSELFKIALLRSHISGGVPGSGTVAGRAVLLLLECSFSCTTLDRTRSTVQLYTYIYTAHRLI